MSANNLAARTPSVVVQIGGTTVPVNSVTLVHAINTPPTVGISLQLENSDASQPGVMKFGDVSIDLNRFAKLNRIVQEKILNNFSITPDLQVDVTDGEEGEGHALTFRGFLGQPDFSLFNGQLGLTMGGLHQMGMLQAFNGQIYQSITHYAYTWLANYFNDLQANPATASRSITPKMREMDADRIAAIATQLQTIDPDARADKSDSVSDRIKAIIQGLHRDFVLQVKGRGASSVNLVDPLAVPVYRVNAAVLPYLIWVLENSIPSTIIENLSSPGFTDDNLHAVLYDLLTGAPNFLASLQALCDEFVLQMNASWDGGVWLEHNATAEPPGTREITVPIEQVRFSMGELYRIPIGQVLVQGRGDEFFAVDGSFSPNKEQQEPPPPTGSPVNPKLGEDFFKGTSALKAFAVYPPKPVVKEGRYVVVPAPRWVNELRYRPSDFRPGKVKIADPASDSIFAKSVVGERKNRNIGGKQDETRKDLMQYYAEKVFKDMYLQGTTAMVSIPLNLKVMVGRTYRVKSVTGAAVFDAYLSSVTHNVVVSNENGAATSTLMFSHVRAYDAKLLADIKPK